MLACCWHKVEPMINVLPVILCGGSGTRLWPLSRSAFPKQFLVFSGKNSLYQNAMLRIHATKAPDVQIGETVVVTHEDQRFLARDQALALGLQQISLLLEPGARNTAPALTLAALHASAGGNDPVLVVSAADHSIPDQQAFSQALLSGVRCAATGAIVTLAVPASAPETGYGYIQRADDTGPYGESQVLRFVEKPDLQTAKRYVQSGNYAWNSGIFILRASVWLEALSKFRPDIHESAGLAWAERSYDQPFVRPGRERFLAIPSESIDYAVMEKCPGSTFPIQAIPLNAGWSDLGAWDAVWQAGDKDANGNVSHGDTLLADTSNTLVHAEGRLVAVAGVRDLVIVETADAVMVADRSQTQIAGALVRQLGQLNRSEHLLHRKTHRPWGWYDNIEESPGFKVKRIQVNPGAMLSLQRHRQRSEHWVVVQGIAEVTCGDKTFVLQENESTFIPLGATHRLRNPGTQALEIIEIQTGAYLGEDDIERLDDVYGRVAPTEAKTP